MIYKILFLAFTGLLFLLRGYFMRGGRKAAVQSHPFKGERILIAATSIWLPLGVIYLLTGWLNGIEISMPAWLRWTGAVLFLAADLLFGWSHAALGRDFTVLIEVKEGHRLVTDGPYRFVRHPMYVAIFLVIPAIFLLTGQWLLALAYGIPPVWLYLLRIDGEEEIMRQAFGEAYSDYCKKTGRLLPKI